MRAVAISNPHTTSLAPSPSVSPRPLSISPRDGSARLDHSTQPAHTGHTVHVTDTELTDTAGHTVDPDTCNEDKEPARLPSPPAEPATTLWAAHRRAPTYSRLHPVLAASSRTALSDGYSPGLAVIVIARMITPISLAFAGTVAPHSRTKIHVHIITTIVLHLPLPSHTTYSPGDSRTKFHVHIITTM